MAESKSTRSRKRRKAVPSSRFLRFPEVKGKVVEGVEIDPDVQAIIILFQDNTALSFDMDCRVSVFPELSDRRDGNWRKIKRWEAVHSSLSMQKWP